MCNLHQLQILELVGTQPCAQTGLLSMQTEKSVMCETNTSAF